MAQAMYAKASTINGNIEALAGLLMQRFLQSIWSSCMGIWVHCKNLRPSSNHDGLRRMTLNACTTSWQYQGCSMFTWPVLMQLIEFMPLSSCTVIQVDCTRNLLCSTQMTWPNSTRRCPPSIWWMIALAMSPTHTAILDVWAENVSGDLQKYVKLEP